ASAPPAFKSTADDDQCRARACRIFCVIRSRPSGFSRPVILRHRFKRFQESPPIGGDLPTVVIPKRISAGENIDGLCPSGKTSHSRAPLGAAGGQNGHISLE